MAFQPMALSHKPAPFDHPAWIFELKYDGFRSLAFIQNGRCQLISRNGHPFSVCEMDLEGIVAKHSFGNYVTEHERTTWVDGAG
jgi:ATP-dependent DNA ligase